MTPVFLDTTVFKFSATALRRYVGRPSTVQWGPLTIHGVSHTEEILNPNDRISDPKLRAEAELLPTIAELGVKGRLSFLISDEARFEQWGLPNLDSETGDFYGASIRSASAPIEYARVMGGLGIDGRLEQARFLQSLNDPRFLELQKASGAYQGKNPTNRNQLIDAFHIWCAEHNSCPFLLTLDWKLQRSLARTRVPLKVHVVSPSELLRALEAGRRSNRSVDSDTLQQGRSPLR